MSSSEVKWRLNNINSSAVRCFGETSVCIKFLPPHHLHCKWMRKRKEVVADFMLLMIEKNGVYVQKRPPPGLSNESGLIPSVFFLMA